MNGYLVLLCHTIDDLPLGLFATFDEARKFASKVKQMPTDAIRSLYCTDCSTPVCVKVVVFDKGEPVDLVLVKDFSA